MKFKAAWKSVYQTDSADEDVLKSVYEALDLARSIWDEETCDDYGALASFATPAGEMKALVVLSDESNMEGVTVYELLVLFRESGLATAAGFMVL